MFSVLDVVNRVLEREPWARAKLAGHAGRAVRVRIGPASAVFAIDGDGRLNDSAVTPDLVLTIAPLQLPALLSQPDRWDELVTVEGEATLAATLRELAQTLPWFVEDLCARVFGPVAGERIADLGRRLLAFPGYAAQRFSDSLTTYVGDEARVAVGAAEARVFVNEIDALAARGDALARRIDRLDHPTEPPSPAPPPRRAAGTKRSSS